MNGLRAFSKIVDYLSERLHKKDTVIRERVKSAKVSNSIDFEHFL